MKNNGSLSETNGSIGGSSARLVLALKESDNVGVARVPLSIGDVIEVRGRQIEAREAITPGHKLALRPIPQGSPVIKYGEVIAKATSDIAQGDWVHTHNTAPDFSGREYEYATGAPVTDFFPPEQAGMRSRNLDVPGNIGPPPRLSRTKGGTHS